jgi:hypothetical protein
MSTGLPGGGGTPDVPWGDEREELRLEEGKRLLELAAPTKPGSDERRDLAEWLFNNAEELLDRVALVEQLTQELEEKEQQVIESGLMLSEAERRITELGAALLFYAEQERWTYGQMDELAEPWSVALAALSGKGDADG